MGDELGNLEGAVKKEWPALISGVGGITALIGLCVTVGGGITWLVNHHRQEMERQARIALAQAQDQQADYAGAIATYDDILKADSLYKPALEGQLAAAMHWVEDFHVIGARTDDDVAPMAAKEIDQIMPVLETGLARTKGTQMADVEAHVGWAHWLNQQIAEREFGPAAEQNLRAALSLDPNNVYANAMLGNLTLMNHGSVADAMRLFDVAVATGNARPFVRRLELGGLRYLDEKGARAAQVKVANDMRKGGEPLDEDHKSRILSFCFDPVVTHRDELVESLSAVPADDAWKTYLWLDDKGSSDYQEEVREFIHANLLELSGDKAGSLAMFRTLQAELKDNNGDMKDQVDAAVARLSHG
jgi:tetratricopeptide (TPR) repeat protein